MIPLEEDEGIRGRKLRELVQQRTEGVRKGYSRRLEKKKRMNGHKNG